MSTLYEYYNTGDDGSTSIYGSGWSAQTFTPSIAHKITSVKLLLGRAALPGTITVSIRATDGSGHPTGEDLCSGTTDGNTLPTGIPYEWREITLGDGYDLSADAKYAIVVRAIDGVPQKIVYWLCDATSPTYAGGNLETSLNSGSSWTSYNDYDALFEEWGEVASTPVNIAGVLGFSGVLEWVRVKTLDGSLSLAGAISRQIAKNVGQGFISLVGILYQKDFKLLAGTLTSSGALIKMTSKAVAGVLSFAGAISKLPQKVMEGVISPAGALARNIYKIVAGVLSPSGRINTGGATMIDLVGNLTSAGTLIKQASKNLLGTLTPSGILEHLRFVAISGTLTSAGSLIKNTGKNLAGLLTSYGITNKFARKLMAGTLTLTGLLQKITSKIAGGVLSFVGALRRPGRDLIVRLFHRPYRDMTTETKPYRDMTVESKDD